MRRLDLVVGPNGAGKSTFVRLTLAPALPPGSLFVNADDIAAERWPEDPAAHAYEASRLAAATREALIVSGESFIAETVFSHPSKVELTHAARAAGYTVVLHVLCVPVELSVARVARRVAAGGHSVPEEKIRARHARLWPLVVEAARGCDATVLYDNSAARGPRILARLAEGDPIGAVTWPDWIDPRLSAAWPAF